MGTIRKYIKEDGSISYPFWMKQYANLHPWPVPYSKSPGDAFEKAHIIIKKWIQCGLLNIGL